MSSKQGRLFQEINEDRFFRSHDNIHADQTKRLAFAAGGKMTVLRTLPVSGPAAAPPEEKIGDARFWPRATAIFSNAAVILGLGASLYAGLHFGNFSDPITNAFLSGIFCVSVVYWLFHAVAKRSAWPSNLHKPGGIDLVAKSRGTFFVALLLLASAVLMPKETAVWVAVGAGLAFGGFWANIVDIQTEGGVRNFLPWFGDYKASTGDYGQITGIGLAFYFLFKQTLFWAWQDPSLLSVAAFAAALLAAPLITQSTMLLAGSGGPPERSEVMRVLQDLGRRIQLIRPPNIPVIKAWGMVHWFQDNLFPNAFDKLFPIQQREYERSLFPLLPPIEGEKLAALNPAHLNVDEVKDLYKREYARGHALAEAVTRLNRLDLISNLADPPERFLSNEDIITVSLGDDRKDVPQAVDLLIKLIQIRSLLRPPSAPNYMPAVCVVLKRLELLDEFENNLRDDVRLDYNIRNQLINTWGVFDAVALQTAGVLSAQGQVETDKFYAWLPTTAWGAEQKLRVKNFEDLEMTVFAWGNLHWQGTSHPWIRVLEMVLPMVGVRLIKEIQDELDRQSHVDKNA